MFNILIVDDERRVIEPLLRVFRHVESCRCFSALDGNSALEFMASERIDLVIVDYLLGPPYQGDELIRLFRNLNFMSGKYSKIPVILMTGTRGLRELKLSMVSLGVNYHLKKDGVTVLLEKALSLLDPTKYAEPIEEAVDDPYYDYDVADWYKISDRVYRNVSLEECPIRQADIGIMVATRVEFDQVARLFAPLKRKRALYKVPHKLETYYIGRFGAFNGVFVKCDAGSSGALGSSYTASKLIDIWKPKVVVMVGIAFGRDRKTHLPGDVLIASEIIPYEKMRVSPEGNVQRGPIPAAGLLLQNRFANAVGWEFNRPDGTRVSVHTGALLSGEKLVDNPMFKKDLLARFPQAIGGEMEGAGLYASSARCKVDWIVVKGVADWGDGMKHKKFQKLAAAAASSLTHFVFSDSLSLQDDTDRVDENETPAPIN